MPEKGVAPRAGAWIETGKSVSLLLCLHVAPRAGAWIETAYHFLLPVLKLGRPPRGGVD